MLKNSMTNVGAAPKPGRHEYEQYGLSYLQFHATRTPYSKYTKNRNKVSEFEIDRSSRTRRQTDGHTDACSYTYWSESF